MAKWVEGNYLYSEGLGLLVEEEVVSEKMVNRTCQRGKGAEDSRSD